MELQLIVKRLSVLFQFKITDDGAMEIARRSRGTPRIAGRLTRRVRDFADVMCCPEVTKDVANDALNQLDVDHSGLDRMDRAYLLTLAEHYKGGPVGADTIAAALSEQKDVVEEVIEPYLMQQGFIQRTPRGRVLTEKAWLHLGLSATITDLC
jgi:Holliday junction DNA helicase RuvB